MASCYVSKHILRVDDDDDNAMCVPLGCTLWEDGTLDWRSSCFLSDILRIIKQAMEQRGVFGYRGSRSPDSGDLDRDLW